MSNSRFGVLVAALIGAGVFLTPSLMLADEAKPAAASAESSKAVAPDETVYLNLRSGKFHNASCQFKKLCTKCVPSTRSDARSKGLEACRVCGG